MFSDTNILYYAFDLTEPRKRSVCKTVSIRPVTMYVIAQEFI